MMNRTNTHSSSRPVSGESEGNPVTGLQHPPLIQTLDILHTTFVQIVKGLKRHKENIENSGPKKEKIQKKKKGEKLKERLLISILPGPKEVMP
jgi:hypothetical protein